MQSVHVGDQPTKTYSVVFVLLALPHPLMLGYGTSGLTVLRDKTSVAYLPSCHLFTLLPIRITVETNTFLIVLLALPHPSTLYLVNNGLWL